MANIGVEDQVSMTVSDYESSSNSDSEEHSPKKFRFFIRNGMLRLQEAEGDEYGTIKRSFMSGMALFSGVQIVAVHKNMYSTHIGEAKLEAFRIFSRAVAEKCGGDANIKYAWYGGSRDEICEILAYGFGSLSQRVGIVLSPSSLPIQR